MLRNMDRLGPLNQLTQRDKISILSNSDNLIPDVKFTFMMMFIVEERGLEDLINVEENTFIMVLEEEANDILTVKVVTTNIKGDMDMAGVMLLVSLRMTDVNSVVEQMVDFIRNVGHE